MRLRALAALLIVAVVAMGCTTTQMRTSCIGAGVVDAGTTAVGISNGATEANPLLRPAPAIGTLVVTALTVIAAEHLRKTGHDTAARWAYGVCALTHGGAAVWNGTQFR